MEGMVSAKMVIDTVTPVIIVLPWKRIEPLVARWRTNYQDPTLMAGFEYLANIICEKHPDLYKIDSVPYE